MAERAAVVYRLRPERNGNAVRDGRLARLPAPLARAFGFGLEEMANEAILSACGAIDKRECGELCVWVSESVVVLPQDLSMKRSVAELHR